MKLQCSILLSSLAGLLLSCFSLSADPVVGSGTFNLNGVANGTTMGIFFYLFSSGDQSAVVLPQPLLGFFGPGGAAPLAPQSVQTIKDLTTANGAKPGPGGFDYKNWIQLTDGVNLDATLIPIPTQFGICSAANDTSGVPCRPDSTSPVVLRQQFAINAKGQIIDNGVVASLVVDGVAHYASSSTDTPYIGSFTATPTQYRTVSDLVTAYLALGGIPGGNYSATFTTTTSVPEPSALALIGGGLLALGFIRRRHPSR